MKLCKDCKHCRPSVEKFLWITSLNYKYAKCAAPHVINLVTGDGGAYCDIERRDFSDCNRNGRFWEAK